MGRRARIVCSICLLVLGAMACTSGEEAPGPSVTLPAAPLGGTLRVGMIDYGFFEQVPLSDPVAWYGYDPQATSHYGGLEILRCCLVRTLMSFPGRPASEGGAIPQPDLADGPPELSMDGLTWTFRLKDGIRYAPPMADVEIVATDFVRALHRSLAPTPPDVLEAVERARGGEGLGSPGAYLGAYSFLYEEIVGAREFREGTAASIAGLETPDDRTLVVHLTEPVGDVPYRFALPATAPIPPSPTDPTALLGVAGGHEDGYGRFLVASGPYMIEGSEDLDIASPAEQQVPIPGYVPRRSIVLVRNPSWERSTDELRGAYADRIEVTMATPPIARGLEELAEMMDGGGLDVSVLDWDTSAQQVERYQADTQLAPRVRFYPIDYMNWIVLDLAVPPFDDVHVRRAFNLALDKQAYTDLIAGEELHLVPYGRVAFDSMTGGLLSAFDPYATAGFHGDIGAAREEMRLSTYDRDGDGRCDSADCEVTPVGLDRGRCREDAELRSICEADTIVRRNLTALGIRVDYREVGLNEYLALPAPDAKEPFHGGIGGLRFGAAQWFSLYFSDPRAAYANGEAYSFVGATAAQLARWGYEITEVPSVDDRIERCQALAGQSNVECWAELDRYLSTEVVPWVPLFVFEQATIVSERVIRFTVDGVFGCPAPDQIALGPGSS